MSELHNKSGTQLVQQRCLSQEVVFSVRMLADLGLATSYKRVCQVATITVP